MVLLLAFFVGSGLNYYENSYGILSVFEPEVSEMGKPEIKTEAQEGMVNINTATKEELCSLYGIADKLSERIIRYREEKGKFIQPQDIMKVNGIGKKLFEKIKDQICV